MTLITGNSKLLRQFCVRNALYGSSSTAHIIQRLKWCRDMFIKTCVPLLYIVTGQCSGCNILEFLNAYSIYKPNNILPLHCDGFLLTKFLGLYQNVRCYRIKTLHWQISLGGNRRWKQYSSNWLTSTNMFASRSIFLINLLFSNFIFYLICLAH